MVMSLRSSKSAEALSLDDGVAAVVEKKATSNSPVTVATTEQQDDEQTTTSTTDTVTHSISSSQEEDHPDNGGYSPSSAPTKRLRRSSRDINRLALSDRSSLQYRRLDELFFQQPPSPAPPSLSFQIGHFTLQRVHCSPNIYVIDSFLNTAELDYFRTKIQNCKFQRSYVDAICNDGGSQYDTTHRTSTFLSFQKQQDKRIATIEQKAADIVGCWTSRSVEPLQLVQYRVSQFFGVHHDLGDYNEEMGTVSLPPKNSLSKRRLITLFVYLNTVESGGATHFPAATNMDADNGLRVYPSPGRAVLFSNVLNTGQPDPRTIHSGEVVTTGTKYGLNIWICEDK